MKHLLNLTFLLIGLSLFGQEEETNLNEKKHSFGLAYSLNQASITTPIFKGQTVAFAYSRFPDRQNVWVYGLRMNKNEFMHERHYANSNLQKKLLKKWTSITSSAQFRHFIDTRKRFFADFGVYGEFMLKSNRTAELSTLGRKGPWRTEDYLDNFETQHRLGLNTALGMYLSQGRFKSFLRIEGQVHLPFYKMNLMDSWTYEGWDIARLELGIQL